MSEPVALRKWTSLHAVFRQWVLDWIGDVFCCFIQFFGDKRGAGLVCGESWLTDQMP